MCPAPAESFDPHAPDARVATALAKLALVFRHEAWRAGGERGLTPTQAQILAMIAGAAEPPGVGAVAEQLAITAGTASAAVSTLVDKKLVRKTRAEHDRRATVLTLTAAGRREASRAAEWPAPIRDAAAALPESERAALLRGLTAMIGALVDRGAIPTTRMCASCTYFRPHAHAGTERAHHCAFIDAAIGDHDLRFDCPDMQPADPPPDPPLWTLLINGRPRASDSLPD